MIRLFLLYHGLLSQATDIKEKNEYMMKKLFQKTRKSAIQHSLSKSIKTWLF